MFTTLLVTGLLGLVDATSLPTPPAVVPEGSAAKAGRPAPPSAADSIVAAAFAKGIDTVGETEKAAPTPAMGWSSLVAPALAIIGLAGLALGLTRRRRAVHGSIRVLEAATLGPRRSLVIADVLGDRLVLGVSEAGIAVLSSRPAPSAETAADPLIAPTVEPVYPRAPRVAPMGFFARLFGKTPAVPFEEVLGESIEDQELRAKLAQGMRGIVP
jgi:flagellar biogenesis protein FliO